MVRMHFPAVIARAQDFISPQALFFGKFSATYNRCIGFCTPLRTPGGGGLHLDKISRPSRRVLCIWGRFTSRHCQGPLASGYPNDRLVMLWTQPHGHMLAPSVPIPPPQRNLFHPIFDYLDLYRFYMTRTDFFCFFLAQKIRSS